MSNALAVLEAYRSGDLALLRELLGDPAGFPNVRHAAPDQATVLEMAIYHGPIELIRSLLELGADPNYEDAAGFPSLIAVLSCGERDDRYELVELLLGFGADIDQRGQNDYTPLHYAACLDDPRAIELLVQHGADLEARTHIDDYATPLEEAVILGRSAAVTALRHAESSARRSREENRQQ